MMTDVMIGDENGDDSVSVSAYSQNRTTIQIQAKLTALMLKGYRRIKVHG